MSPELTAAIKAVGGALAAGFSAVILGRRRRKMLPHGDTDARLRALEVAVAKAEVTLRRIEPLAETVVELRELAARTEALLEAANARADALAGDLERVERVLLETRGLALAPVVEVVG